MERETGQKDKTPVRKCLTCGVEMEYNPVTGGYFCTVCGRLDRPAKDGFTEDGYLSAGRIVAETDDETDRKCGSCGGVMSYDPETKTLLCPFCKNSENLGLVSLGYRAAENDFEREKRRANRNWGFKTKTVFCEYCGGKTIYDYLALSGKCPYCGSNQVTEVKNAETLAPGGVCPFTVKKEDAAKSFQKWIKKRRFCPREVKLNSKPKDITGVYLPFWTFDTATVSPYTAACVSNKTDEDIEVSKAVPSKFTALAILGKLLINALNNAKTVSGIHRQFFNDVPVSASENHDAALLKKLEPYNTNNSTPYSPEFIAGFAAEQYSVGLDEAWEKARERCKEKLKKSITTRVKNENYTNAVSNVDFKTDFSEVTFKYLLLPVWISSYIYRGKIYQFMVNGCTGKTAGRFPVSKGRVAAAAFGALALAALLVYFFFFR